MIFLFTDFGVGGPYIGQLHAKILSFDPTIPVIDLMHDAPAFQPLTAAHMLGALIKQLPEECVVVAVVDPGVGTTRRPLALKLGRRWLVGPDNGLFDTAVRGKENVDAYEIVWRPPALSASFHGRDLFAPIAAMLCLNKLEKTALAPVRYDARDLQREHVVYIDTYGNLTTGLCAGEVEKNRRLMVENREVEYAETFGSVGKGELFWYENSLGLVEIAANRDSAARISGATLGSAVTVV